MKAITPRRLECWHFFSKSYWAVDMTRKLSGRTQARCFYQMVLVCVSLTGAFSCTSCCVPNEATEAEGKIWGIVMFKKFTGTFLPFPLFLYCWIFALKDIFAVFFSYFKERDTNCSKCCLHLILLYLTLLKKNLCLAPAYCSCLLLGSFEW